MGHKLDSSQLPYFLGNPEQEKELYSKYVPYLTIAEAYDPTKDPVFKMMQEENVVLTRMVENTVFQTKNTRSEVDILKNQLEEMSNHIVKLNTMMLEKSPETIAVRREKTKRIIERSERERSEVQ